MKDRHWDRIAKCTGHTFDLESDTFALRNIMEADLLPHKEDIEVCNSPTEDVAVACSHLERSGMGTACSRSASAHLYHAGSRLLPCDGAAD